MKKALITGITGQDGSYLAELLLSKNYEVHGVIRNSSSFNRKRIEHIIVDVHEKSARLFLHYADLTDSSRITALLYDTRPDEVYHLGAQSHVKQSFENPEYTGDVTGVATVRVLEGIRRSGIKAKFYQASSSEMFGSTPPPQNEHSLFHPVSPYAAAKLYGFWITANYRDAYGIFASNGILFNHESPRRGDAFVTKKITRVLAQILAGKQKALYLGNLNSQRDWGFAPEYVEGMHKILQHDRPGDFVFGTGETHRVREFVTVASRYAGVDIEWKGDGVEETGVVRSLEPRAGSVLHPGDVIVKIDPWYFRPSEVEALLADPSKAEKELGWHPRVHFDLLVKIMMDFDLAEFGLAAPGEGRAELQRLGFGWTTVG